MKRFIRLAAIGLLSSASLFGASQAFAQSYEFRYQSTVRGGAGPGGSAANCTTPWGVSVPHTQDVQAFATASVPFGQACQDETRVCNDGTLSGTFGNASCVIDAPLAQCALPWGGEIASGSSVEAFLTPTVAFGVDCVSESRLCFDGDLSGAMINEACVADAQDLTPASFTLAGVSNVTPGGWAMSVPTRVTGITGDVPIAVSDFDHEASLQICLDVNCIQVVEAWTDGATTIRDGQFFQMRFRASDSLSTNRTKSVIVGAFTTAFSSTTTATYCGGVARRCEDGTIFVGTFSGKATFAMPCDAGQSYNGTSCVGTRDMSRPFGPQGETIRTICSNGAQVTCESGRDNTEALAAAGPQYQVASYCAGLSAHGHDDWYLPARNEMQRLMARSQDVDLAGTFLMTQSNYYFTSSELSTTNSVLWYAYPSPNGQVSSIPKNFQPYDQIPIYTRCVRSVG